MRSTSSNCTALLVLEREQRAQEQLEAVEAWVVELLQAEAVASTSLQWTRHRRQMEVYPVGVSPTSAT